MSRYYDDNDIQAAREAIALEHWEAMDTVAQDWLQDCASDYIVGLAQPGDGYAATYHSMRRDCLAGLAVWVSDREAKARCRDLGMYEESDGESFVARVRRLQDVAP